MRGKVHETGNYWVPKAAAAGKNQDWGQNQGDFHAAGKDKNIHLHLSPQVTGNTRSLEVIAAFEIQRSRKAEQKIT